MNRLYKSFFSKQLGRFVVTSEKARTKTKSSKTTTVAAAIVASIGVTFSAGAMAATSSYVNQNPGLTSDASRLNNINNTSYTVAPIPTGSNATGMFPKNYEYDVQEVLKLADAARLTKAALGNVSFETHAQRQYFERYLKNITDLDDAVRNNNGVMTNEIQDQYEFTLYGILHTYPTIYDDRGMFISGESQIFGLFNQAIDYLNGVVKTPDMTGWSAEAIAEHELYAKKLADISQGLTDGTFNTVLGNNLATIGSANTNIGYRNHVQGDSATAIGNNNIVHSSDNITNDYNITGTGSPLSVLGHGNEIFYTSGTVVGNNNLTDTASGTILGDANEVNGSSQVGIVGNNNIVSYSDNVLTNGNSNQLYESKSVNVFGSENRVASSDTTVIGNRNSGQNATYEAKRMMMTGINGYEAPYRWEAENLVENYYRYHNSDNSIVSGNDNIYGANTSIHGLSNSAYGQDHNITGSNNTTYGEGNNIHGTNNLVGEVEYTNNYNIIEWFYTAETGRWDWRYAQTWGPTGISEAYDNNVVGNANVVAGSSNTSVGSFNTVYGDGAISLGNHNFVDNGLALGNNNSVASGNIALGAGIIAEGMTLNNQAYYIGGVAEHELVIGINGEDMRITGVAAGSNPNDAVNVEQLTAVVNDLGDKGSVKYKLITDASGNPVLDANGLRTYDYTTVDLTTKSEIETEEKYQVSVVKDGTGTVIDNVANATEADHAVNKGQLDFAIAGVNDGLNGTVKYERDADGNINFDKAVLEGKQTVIAADSKYSHVQVVTEGGTVIDNVANATEADHAVNKGQMDVAIAGVQDGLDGTVKYVRDTEGKIDFTNVVLATETVKGVDANGTDYVLSGGSTINNVATATEYHQAINKGQFDQGLNALRDGAVMYALNLDGSVNKDVVNLMGTKVTIGQSFGVQVVTGGGTVINNVANAYEAHQAINKGQLDEAIAQIYLENDGALVKYDIANGDIDYKNVTLANDVVLGTDSYGIQVVTSGGTNINNVATATEAHQAVNKGQMDSEFAKRDDLLAGTVQYDRNSDNSINFNQVTLSGDTAVTEVNEIGVEVVTSGGTVLANVANATEAHHAINKGQFDDAITRIEAETESAVKYDKNADGSIDYSNVTLAGEKADVQKNSDGIDVVVSGGTSINNVANATEVHQAINKGQFDEALSKIEGESAGNVKYDKNADGSINYNSVTYTGDKAVVETNDTGVEVVTSGGSSINNVATATEVHQAINKGQFDDGLARLEDGAVQYARNEDGTVNKNLVVLGGDKAVVTKNEAGIEVVSSGGTVISNVAVATEAHHAINKGQFDEGMHQARDYADQGDINTLNSANAYTDNRVSALWDEFQDESKDLRAGIAGAMAVGNLPQPSEAGYSMFSMGVATYKGQQAIAMGLSAITEDKRYIFKIAATTTTRNDTGGAASVGVQWK